MGGAFLAGVVFGEQGSRAWSFQAPFEAATPRPGRQDCPWRMKAGIGAGLASARASVACRPLPIRNAPGRPGDPGRREELSSFFQIFPPRRGLDAAGHVDRMGVQRPDRLGHVPRMQSPC